MRSLALGSVAAGLMLVAGAQGAVAVELSADYLHGRWTSGGPEACNKTDSEFTEFRADGSFITSRGNRAAAVGFWTLNDDQLELQALAHDGLHPALQAIPGDYAHFVIRALLFDIADNSYRMVMSIGDTLQGSNVVRCP
jgi:hypothetical protein